MWACYWTGLPTNGQTWQRRWVATGADADGRCWRQIPAQWLREHGHPKEWLQYWLFRALLAAIAADLIRPSLSWLVTAAFRRGTLLNIVSGYRDPDGFARLRALCSTDSDINAAAANRTTNRAALILAAKGGTLADITPGDVLALFDVEADTHATSVGATHLFYRVLHALGGFGAEAPATLRELRAAGQRSPEELIDRYELVCQPIRNLLVDYLRERQPALDYTSLDALAYYLGGLFWSDLERHHPGISSLHLPAEVASAWKQRLRTITKVSRGADGKTVRTTAERVNYRKCLTPVRAFYLDLACWAAEDPARWGPWVVPCPVGAEEVNQRKDKRRRKSRMDARTRERLPVLPVLVRDLDERRKTAAALLDAARRTEPGQQFSVAETTLTRIRPGHSAAAKIWVQEPQTGKRRDLGWEEDRAFWTFAAVEVLRSTGIRIEELTELSHHSLVQYRLPSTGEMVPLLQITRRRPTLNGCSWSARNWPKCCRRSSTAFAVRPARSRWYAPTTRRNETGLRRCRCCSSDAWASSIARSAARPSARCSPIPRPANRCDSPHTTFAACSSPTPCSTACHRTLLKSSPATATSTSPSAIRPSTPTRLSNRTWLFSPAGARYARPTNTANPQTRNGSASSATSNVAKFPSAPADAPSAPPASMNMLVSVAHCSGQTPLNDPDWSRSAKTCKPASPKPNARAGSAKSKDSRSASPEPRTNSLNSTVAGCATNL